MTRREIAEDVAEFFCDLDSGNDVEILRPEIEQALQTYGQSIVDEMVSAVAPHIPSMNAIQAKWEEMK